MQKNVSGHSIAHVPQGRFCYQSPGLYALGAKLDALSRALAAQDFVFRYKKEMVEARFRNGLGVQYFCMKSGRSLSFEHLTEVAAAFAKHGRVVRPKAADNGRAAVLARRARGPQHALH